MRKLCMTLWILCTALVMPAVCRAQSVADSVAIVSADWHVEQVAEGLTVKKASFEKLYRGPQQVSLLEVDTRKHPLRILEHDGRELTTLKAQENGAVGAINGTYFDMGEKARSVCFLAVDGAVVDYTNGDMGLLSDGAVVVRKKKVSVIPWRVADEKTFKIKGRSVMCCGPLMVLDGKEVDLGLEPGGHIPLPNPRSGVALLGKNRVMLILVDGRRPGTATGVTIAEFAHLNRILGAKDALNLDGGGSSVIWTSGTGILNNPSDGRERTVANSILVQ